MDMTAQFDPQIIIVLFGLFSAIGVFFLFALAIGLIRFSKWDEKDLPTSLIAETSTNGLLVTLGVKEIIYANPAYLHLASARSLNEAPSLESIFSGPPESSEALYRLAQAARSWTPLVEELKRAPALNGSLPVGWYRIGVKPITYRGSRACLWEIIDLTDERSRLETVFERLNHGVSLLNHAPVGFFSSRANGDISYMNETLAGWLGLDLSQNNQVQANLSSLLVSNNAVPINLRGEPGEILTAQVDIDLKRQDGVGLPTRIIHQVIFSRDGTALPSRSLVLDRSTRDADNNALRAAEIGFSRFYNSTPVAIASIDAGGRLIEANPSFARLFPQAYNISLERSAPSWALLIDLSDTAASVLKESVQAVMAGQSPSDPVDVVYDIEGSKHAARCFISRGYLEQGEAALFYALDITAQQRLQEEFAHSQKLNDIGLISGIIAHDLNNILTPILGGADLLLSSHRPTDPSFKDIHQIKYMAQRAATLTRQLLAFSRRQKLNPQICHVSDLLSEFYILLCKIVDEKTEIDLRHGRDLGLVKVDRVQLEQVMIDLVANARDSMPAQGGIIHIRTKNVAPNDCASYHPTLPENGYVLIEVQDNGSGIPAEIKEKIFEPFFTTKPVGQGAGLGLSSAIGVIQQSKGHMLCESVVGEGATFRIFLPHHREKNLTETLDQEIFDQEILDQDHPPIILEPSPLGERELITTGSILLVDDDNAVRSFVAHILKRSGFIVYEAEDGQHALELIEEKSGDIDIVVTDVEMPEMDGPSMCLEITKRKYNPKFIFMSGYTEEDLLAAHPEMDFLFVKKPFENRQMIETIKNALNAL